MRKKSLLLLIIIPIIIAIIIWLRAPIRDNDWSKQTIYVGLLDAWYGASTDERAYAMWIDDDSSEGVFIVKRICDDAGIKPVFAVVSGNMTKDVADSIASWQKLGAGVLLHGLHHESWKNWSEAEIRSDIIQSYTSLAQQKFDTSRILKMIIPPYGCNTRTIRKVIKQQGCQMISGACLVNPDRHVFQLGRIGISPQTDTIAMRKLLEKAYDRKAFVIFGTHSSIPLWFSEEKTRAVIEIAKEIGFAFISQQEDMDR